DVASLGYETFKTFSPLFMPDIRHALDIKASINGRAVPGGTAERQVRIALEKLEKKIKHYESLLKKI
ncbi:MAG: hypothetical protein M1591_01310, partial [Deltaproteobacteria bacterium]|nr:hypothetical protein [Deltaproteobacteria bacterium]